MSDEVPEFFVDMITNVSMANGVFRVTFAQQEANNTSRAMVKVLVPSTQLAGVLNGLKKAADEIESRLKSQPAGGAATPPKPRAPVPLKKAGPARKSGKK